MVTMSCTLTPLPDIAEQAMVAESLGYSRVWINDSPNIYPDVWMLLTIVAAATERIGIGPAVLVPSLRHVVTTANAITTLERLAPGRVAVTIGTGNTGRRLLGQKPLPWAEVVAYIDQLKRLLRGDLVEIDGRQTRLVHAPGIVAARPVSVPLLIAAMGPVGERHARAVADGIFRIKRPAPGFPWCAVTVTGTVLDPGETFDSPRVLRDAGPGIALAYHEGFDAPGGAERLQQLPHGPAWLAAMADVPEEVRHLAVHSGHFVSSSGPDALLVDAGTVQRFTFSDHDDALRERLQIMIDGGMTEVSFHPTGVDTARELAAFARVMEPFRA
jgi:5,10-methylenetetrahydromethanopterin reductase